MARETTAERPRPSILSLGIAVFLIPAILGSSQMVFNDITTTGSSPVQKLTITNTGTA